MVSAKPVILIVDDDRDFRISTRALLESEGYKILEADSGHEALKMLHRHHPSAILLDVMMETSVEGYGVNQAIKYQDEFRELRDVPIIMCSSIEMSPDERFARAEEMEMIHPDRYVTKPLDFDQLLELLDEVLGKTHP